MAFAANQWILELNFVTAPILWATPNQQRCNGKLSEAEDFICMLSVIAHPHPHTHTYSPAARPMPGNGRRKLCEDSGVGSRSRTTDERWICNESFVDFHLIYLLRSSTPSCCSFILAKNENILHFTDPKCVHFVNSATLRLNDACITRCVCLLWETHE